MNVITPIVHGVQVCALMVTIEPVTMEMIVQRMPSLLWIGLNQNSVLRACCMTQGDQERWHFVAIGIESDLIVLRMHGGKHFSALETVVCDGHPSWNLTLTKLGQSSSWSVPTLNNGERTHWSNFFMRWKVNPMGMTNTAKITTTLINFCRIQSIENGCMLSKLTSLTVGLKHVPACGESTSPERRMPEVSTMDPRVMI